MGAMMEASGAMHLVDQIPVDDEKKLRGMSRVFLRDGMDLYDMMEFATNAYKIGRETEARRHECFILGSLEDAEHISILRAMEAAGFDAMKARAILKIGRSTMYRKLKYFRIHYAGEKKVTEDEEVEQ